MPSVMDRVQLALGRKVQDPVCKMIISKRSAAATSGHGGRTYYFCGVGCKETFDAEPGGYTETSERRTSA